MGKIRIAVVGVGNCASALIQGIGYYRELDRAHCDDSEEFSGLIHRSIGPYGPGHMEKYPDEDARVGLEDFIDRAVRLRKHGQELVEAVSKTSPR